MFDVLDDLMDRDGRRADERQSRRSGLRGLLDRLMGGDDDHRADHGRRADRSRDDDDDDERGRSGRRRERFDFDD